jgi:hypothetical protein
MDISARILPEITLFGIIKLVIKAKNRLLHSGERLMPDPEASLSVECSGTPQPPPIPNAAPPVKNRGAGSIKPDVSATVR